MPFIRTTTSAVLDDEKEDRLRKSLAFAVDKYLGKNPVRMMTAFEGSVHMCRGPEKRADAPVAFVECKFFGGENYTSFEDFDKAIKESFAAILKTAPEDLYIKYEVINGWDQPAQIFKI